MRIIVVGAGDVGTHLVERLSAGGEDVTVIEADPVRAALLQDSVDALVLVGNGATVPVLEEAGARDADLLIAVSTSDGVNILSCYTATNLGATTTIARIEDPGLREGADRLGVDYILDPSATAATELASIVAAGGASELIHFAEGRLVMVGGTVSAKAPLVGRPLAELRLRNAEWGWVVAALVREGRTTVAHGDTVLREGDHALVMTTADRVEEASHLIGLKKRKLDRPILLGSTRLARLTAKSLEADGLHLVFVEEDHERCQQLAEQFPSALVLNSSPTNPDVFAELELGPKDVVMGLSGFDEVNVLACLVAKAQGAGMVIARFHRVDYVGLLAGIGIDAAISSRLMAANAILRFVRSGSVEQVATFSDTDAEAIDIEVQPSAPAVGKALHELELPTGVVIGGISRNETTFVPDGSSVVRAGDHIVFFALPRDIEASTALFTA